MYLAQYGVKRAYTRTERRRGVDCGQISCSSTGDLLKLELFSKRNAPRFSESISFRKCEAFLTSLLGCFGGVGAFLEKSLDKKTMLFTPLKRNVRVNR